MESLLAECFAPTVMIVASADCEELYHHPIMTGEKEMEKTITPVRLVSFPEFGSDYVLKQFAEQPNAETLIQTLQKQMDSADSNLLFNSVLKELVLQTTRGKYAQPFETWGHPLACILVVSSANSNPISELTQLYQQSFAQYSNNMSSDFLRCVIYLTKESHTSAESFDTVSSQFGPHCYEITDPDQFPQAVQIVASQSVYPYMDQLVRNWQLGNSTKTSNGFGFGKFLKKLVNSGPPRPETNLFALVCRDMQPHVASIPAKRRDLDIDMQLRRLADVSFILKDYKLAKSAYDALRKLFNADQKWAQFGGACEMSALCGSLLQSSEVSSTVDAALYTYNSRVHLDAHALRCVLLVCGSLVEFGDQLLAASLLSNYLFEIESLPGSASSPAEAAILMVQTALAYEKRGWQRKKNLWSMLADKEWKLVT